MTFMPLYFAHSTKFGTFNCGEQALENLE